jgi:hypothetical protein
MFALTQLAIADFEEHESSENALAVAEQFEARLVTADQTFNPNVVIGLLAQRDRWLAKAVELDR